jgi:hypothetical protein
MDEDNKTILLNISEEYGYQHWWVLYTKNEFAEACRRWKTMKGLNCLVPVDLIFLGARGQFGEWPPKAVCKSLAAKCKVYCAHVHEADDSHLATVSYTIPETVDGNEDLFELDGVVYTDNQIMQLLDESRTRRNDDFYALYPEYAPQTARAEPKAG